MYYIIHIYIYIAYYACVCASLYIDRSHMCATLFNPRHGPVRLHFCLHMFRIFFSQGRSRPVWEWNGLLLHQWTGVLVMHDKWYLYRDRHQNLTNYVLLIWSKLVVPTVLSYKWPTFQPDEFLVADHNPTIFSSGFIDVDEEVPSPKRASSLPATTRESSFLDHGLEEEISHQSYVEPGLRSALSGPSIGCNNIHQPWFHEVFCPQSNQSAKSNFYAVVFWWDVWGFTWEGNNILQMFLFWKVSAGTPPAATFLRRAVEA